MSTSPVATRSPRVPRSAQRGRATVVAVALVAAVALAGCITDAQGKTHGMVNMSRHQAGLPALAHDGQAQAKAQAWAERLASRNQLAHSRLSDGLSGWKLVAENVGWASSTDEVHRRFMESAPHRANILDRRFTHLGTGVATGHGKTYVVHVFVKR